MLNYQRVHPKWVLPSIHFYPIGPRVTRSPKKTRPGGFEEPPLHGTAKLYGSTAAQLPSEKPGLLVPNFTHLLGFYFWIFLESFPGDFQVLQHVQYFHYSRPNFCGSKPWYRWTVHTNREAGGHGGSSTKPINARRGFIHSKYDLSWYFNIFHRFWSFLIHPCILIILQIPTTRENMAPGC